jgi:hypothetical protein
VATVWRSSAFIWIGRNREKEAWAGWEVIPEEAMNSNTLPITH